MDFQRMYDSAPTWFQNMMTTVYGYRKASQRFGKAYAKYFNSLDELYSRPREELVEYQLVQLIRLLNYAKEHSLFYRKLYRDIDTTKLRTLDDMTMLPIVTKEMLRNNWDNIVTIPKSAGIRVTTGGTTGKSLVVYFTPDDLQRRMATLYHFKMRHGFVNIKMKRATFSGHQIVPPGQKSTEFWRYNAAENQMLYSVFHMNDTNMRHYVECLQRFRPDAIDGFMSSIYLLANYIDKKGIGLDFVPRAIFPTSENTTIIHRELVEKVFRCKVRDQYASGEGAPFVWECVCGKLHYDLTTGIVEQMEGSHEVLVTSFTTYGTPLIRYRIGDCMQFDDDNARCECGLSLPIIRALDGRRQNYLVSTDGTLVSEVAATFSVHARGVRKYQIIQDAPRHVSVHLVLDDEFDPVHLDLLSSDIHHKLGRDMQVDFVAIHDIPVEANGKFPMVVNRMVNR